MRKTLTFLLTLIVAAIGLTAMAQAPQTGVYRIQNVGKSTYVKVTGKYDAQLVTSKNEASYITVGIEKKLSDGTYKVNSLYSTYDGGSVEVYDYLTKALTLGEIELRRELAGSSEEHVLMAIQRMHELVQEYGFMRMMPVDGQADTYHAIAVLPTIPDDIVAVWRAKKNPDGSYVSQITGGNTMWDWCIDIVYRYLDEHSGAGGTNAGLAAKIRNNLKNIKEGHTYMLTADEDGSFGYIDTDGALTSSNNRSWWKLTPKVNNENVKDGTYKIRNIGNKKYVRIRGRYYATPDAEEGDASDIRITFDGEANGGQKIINLGGTYNGTDIDIYSYIEKAIMIGKMAIYDVLTDGNGVHPASPENIEVAQNYLENEIKKGAFMCIKPVEGNDEAVYAYVTIPHIPEAVVTQMYQHNAITADSEELAWQFGVNKVKQYLNDHNGQGGTDNTLRSYILANINKIRPGVTYYLSAESNGTFDYYPKFDTYNNWGSQTIIDNFNDIKENTLFQWGFDVKDVEEDNLTSGTYKIRNVEYKNYVEVLSKYYAKPDTDEAGATEIHITYNGKLDDGSYKVTNMSAVAKDGSTCDIQSYVDKAIMLGKVAIADVLSGEVTVNGETVHVASPENIKKAQNYMEQFVRESAYMRVKPVVGTNYVYAIATIPEIPAEVVEEMVAHIEGVNNAQDCWNYGKQYVLNYLEGHPNSTLVSLITNNLNNLTPGHTYYLSEDADKTFGYKDYDKGEVSLDDKTIQWGIDLEEEDQPVESDFYKIHNVGNDKYVKVYGRYYAKPNVDEAEATPIAVTIDGMLEDGSMKVTNLVGDGHDIRKYIDHAIELGTALLQEELSSSDPDNVERAIKAMTDFINENAYMRVKLVPGETDAYYAYVVLPTVPDSIVTEWRKKNPSYEGTMRDWAVEKVLAYLNNHPQVDGTLAAMVRNNIGRLYEGHTYYLRADGDGTFGFADATLNEMDFGTSDAAKHYWWGFADAIKAEPFSGYYRIKGADGKYVNVTGKFAATPNLDADGAKTAAGSVIYISTGETKDTKTLPLEVLRSQGVDVGNKSEAGYMNMINDVLLTVANKIAEIAAQKIAENPNYSQYAGLVEPLVQTLLEGVDMNLYVEPTITSDGKEVYMLEVNIPDLKEYCSLAQDALSLVNEDGHALAGKIRDMKDGDEGVMNKLLEAAAQCAELLDGQSAQEAADDIWTLLKQKGKTFLSSYGSQLSRFLPEQAITFINNALNNPDFNYGTTYCLRQDTDGTFGYASRESLINSDAAKWILEPFDEQDPNYDETAYVPFYLKADLGQETYEGVQNEAGEYIGSNALNDTYYFTTTYLDFDAKIETPDNGAVVNVYKVTKTKYLTSVTKAVGDKPEITRGYYIAELTEVEDGDVIPAATPVVVRTSMAPADAEEAGLNIKLRPVGTPTHKAVESEEYLAMKEQLLDLFNSKIQGYTQNAPSPKAIAEPTNDNLLVGSFFDQDVKAKTSDKNEDIYLKLGKNTVIQEEENPGLDMNGLGFWKSNVSTLNGNEAYLLGTNQVGFMPKATINDAAAASSDDGSDGIAPGYIFQYPDGTFTRIENVTTTKEVKSVRYYNIMGVESTTPFEGVNIIVTTFTDGTRATTKAIK